MLKVRSFPLKKTAKNLVFGEGSPDAQVFLIGEAPGAKEDEQGRPFVGLAGRQLEMLLNSVSLAREEVYITSILKYRPPKNRPPKFSEIKAHTPYLVEQIKIIRPKIIVTLGNFATKFVLADFDIHKMKKVAGITTLHGKAITDDFGGMRFMVMPVFHPAAVFYNPRLKEILKEDFKNLLLYL